MSERTVWLAAARDLRERAAVVKDVGGGHPTAGAIVEALTDAAIAFETKASVDAVVSQLPSVTELTDADLLTVAHEIVRRLESR